MTELLKHLEGTDESSIPLLQDEINNESGLFTDEEIRNGNRRKLMKRAGKIFIPLLLIVIFVILSVKTYKTISSNLLNQKVEYKLHSISVKNASEKGFEISVNATVDAKVPWSVDFEGTSVEILTKKSEKSVISVEIPDMKIISGEPIDIKLLNQSVSIEDAKSLADIVNNSIELKKVKVPLRIKTRVHPHWIPFTFKNVEIEKEFFINLDGNNGGNGDLSKYIKLKDLKMEETSNDDLIVTAQVGIMNPLPFSIDKIPPISFKVFYSDDKIFIGKVKTLETIRLKKGSTDINLQGHLRSNDSRSSDAIGELITNHLLGKKSKIYLQGDDEASTNGKKLNWLQSILIHVNVPVEIHGKSLKEMFEDSIKRIEVKRMFVALDPGKPNQIELKSDAEVHFHVPRIASMMRPTIESLTLEGSVLDQKGNFLAPLSIPNHHVGQGLSNQNSLNTSMKMNIHVTDANLSNIETLMAEMLNSQDATVSVAGHSSVKTKMFLGRMTVPSVPFAAEIKLPGLGRILSSQEPEIKDIEIIEITPEEIRIRSAILIDNPTEITSLMGSMHLNCISEETRQVLGTVFMKNAAIRPGKNELKAEISFKKTKEFEEFLGKYFSGHAQNLILQGISGSEVVHPILKNVIGAFVMRATLKPESKKFGSFVSAVTLKRKGFNLIPEAFMTVSNPFPFPMRILSVKNLSVYAYKSTGERILITEMDQVPQEQAIIIPATVENWTDEENPLPLEINGNILRSIKALQMLLSKENPKDANGKRYLPIRLEGRIRSEMDSIQLEFTFIKDRLPLYLETGF